MNNFDAQCYEFKALAHRSMAEVQAEIHGKMPNWREPVFNHLLNDVLRRGKVRMLEIGVFMAGTIKYAMAHCPQIKFYTGVDDYGKSCDSPYVSPTSYWKSREEANAQYEKSAAIFEKYGQKLWRMTSDEFISQWDGKTFHDIIFVDGNHVYEFALRDMKNFMRLVTPGGVMLVDDYDNPDHPGVSKAVVEFIRINWHLIERIKAVRVMFVNGNKIVPTSKIIMGIEKIGSSAHSTVVEEFRPRARDRDRDDDPDHIVDLPAVDLVSERDAAECIRELGDAD